MSWLYMCRTSEGGDRMSNLHIKNLNYDSLYKYLKLYKYILSAPLLALALLLFVCTPQTRN